MMHTLTSNIPSLSQVFRVHFSVQCAFDGEMGPVAWDDSRVGIRVASGHSNSGAGGGWVFGGCRICDRSNG